MGQYIDTFRAQPTEELLQRLRLGDDELLDEARADIEAVLIERGATVPTKVAAVEQPLPSPRPRAPDAMTIVVILALACMVCGGVIVALEGYVASTAWRNFLGGAAGILALRFLMKAR